VTKEQLAKLIKDHNVKIVDLKFVDLPGLWQHFTVPVAELDDNVWVQGLGFDGSSIRGFQKIEESDMLIVPDIDTAVLDPATQEPTISLICDIHDPIKKQPYSRDPRGIARKAEAHLKSSGQFDTSYWGPEAEFFVFNDARFDQTANAGYYFLDSREARWNSGRDEGPNLAYKIPHKEGYFPVAPFDTLMDIRTEMVLAMKDVGIEVEAHHHEVATAGQNEIDMRFDTLVNMADKLMMYKYIVKNVARKHNMVATFMPKPLFGDNGSGMHCHQSLWKSGENTFFDASGYALTSETCRWYIGGLLAHARALMSFCAPTTNSYKRLVPGYEAPVNLVYSARNRSAACRIPMISENPKAKRVEFRPPDPLANPYLAFSAMLMAGLDGIANKIDPGKPLERNTYELSPEESANIKTVPGSLEESVQALEADHDFLLRGDVFTEDVLEHWLEWQKDSIDQVRLRPHPHEFNLYFGS
jgi:glutamine synthetase